MIQTIWKNPTQQLISTAGGETGLFLQHIDLATIWTPGKNLTLEIEALLNATPTGAANLMLNYAFSSAQYRTAAELLGASSQYVMALPNVASVRRVFLAPLTYVGARWLHIWLDHDAIAANSTIEVTTLLNSDV